MTARAYDLIVLAACELDEPIVACATCGDPAANAVRHLHPACTCAFVLSGRTLDSRMARR